MSNPFLVSQQAQTKRRGSVQKHFVRARHIHDHLLCLSSSGDASDVVTVLAIEGISYDLKSPEEQHLLNDQFQALLAGLSSSIQVLWRVLPLNLHDYLAQFALPEREDEAGIWSLLSRSHAAFFQQFAQRRTLLHRRIYLILRADGRNMAQTRVRQLFQRTRKRDWSQQLEQARQELDLRAAEMMRQLGDMGLSVRQLRGEQELVPFYYSCLTPEKADRFPLPKDVIAALERPIETLDPRPALVPVTQAPVSAISTQKPLANEPPPRGLSHLADLVAPAAITLLPDLLIVEKEYTRVLVVRNLPRTVSAGWLKPLADLDEPMEVSFHLQPLSSASMIDHLRRQHRAYRSSQAMAHGKGNDANPMLKVADGDVSDLLPRLASGEERMLEVSLLVQVRGRTKRLLNERTARVQAVLHTMLLVAHEALFEQEHAFRSCLPHGRNEMTGMLLDSRSGSTLFPFLSNTLFHPNGLLEGITPQGDPVILDAWGEGMANANRIVLGPPGWGKSHGVKTTLIRQVLKASAHQQRTAHETLSAQIILIDPEREYTHMTTLFGGQVIRLSPGSAHHLNPFDLPARREEEHRPEHGDRLADHVQKLHTLLEIMLADRTPSGAEKLSSNEKGLLDRAFYEAYRKVGITSDPKTHDRAAPLMRDVYEVLESGACGADTTGLTQRLHRFVYGSLAGLFAGPTNVSLDRILMAFDIKDLHTELRPIGLFLVSNFVWTESFQSTIPRQLIVDEAATLMHYESGAVFLEDLVRRARKHYLGVTVITQHPLIFEHSSIPANCATHVLMRQDATSRDLVQQMFRLSSREGQLLARLPIGEALLLTSEKRLQVRFEASEVEHLLATTNRREILAWREQHQDAQFLQLLHQLGLDEEEESAHDQQSADEEEQVRETASHHVEVV